MKLPSIINEPEFERDYTEVHYFKNSHSDDIGTIKLPKWLSKLIKDEVQQAIEEGKLKIKMSLKTLIGVE